MFVLELCFDGMDFHLCHRKQTQCSGVMSTRNRAFR